MSEHAVAIRRIAVYAGFIEGNFASRSSEYMAPSPPAGTIMGYVWKGTSTDSGAQSALFHSAPLHSSHRYGKNGRILVDGTLPAGFVNPRLRMKFTKADVDLLLANTLNSTIWSTTHTPFKIVAGTFDTADMDAVYAAVGGATGLVSILWFDASSATNISNSDVTLTLDSATGFPTPPFYLNSAFSEDMLATASAGPDAYTVLRAQNGTSATSLSIGDAIFQLSSEVGAGGAGTPTSPSASAAFLDKADVGTVLGELDLATVNENVLDGSLVVVDVPVTISEGYFRLVIMTGLDFGDTEPAFGNIGFGGKDETLIPVSIEVVADDPPPEPPGPPPPSPPTGPIDKTLYLDWTGSAPSATHNWCPNWTTPATSMALSRRSDGSLAVLFGTCDGTGRILRLDESLHNDDGQAIESFYQTAFGGGPSGRNSFQYLTSSAKGAGQLGMTAIKPDGVTEVGLKNRGLEDEPLGDQEWSGLRVNGERIAWRFGTNAVDAWWKMRKLVAYVVPSAWSRTRGGTR